MHVIKARNVNYALLEGVRYLSDVGIKRDSRNGPVLVAPTPVTTIYERPLERVLFWPDRDANPFFHLYESLWMLAGRNDITPLVRYNKQMQEYSDNGTTQHGAYGFRWRKVFGADQLEKIAEGLQKNRDDRRQVLQMWEAVLDLGRIGKDVPCNLMCTFQVNTQGALDLTVFCRSNDIIWGAYGANAVHFSFLLEYMALWIGVPVGQLYQVSVNWHAYINIFDPLAESFKDPMGAAHDYQHNAKPLLLTESISNVDISIRRILMAAELGTFYEFSPRWAYTTSGILYAHHLWRTKAAPEKYEQPLEILNRLDPEIDFVIAAKDWIARRATKWMQKMVQA